MSTTKTTTFAKAVPEYLDYTGTTATASTVESYRVKLAEFERFAGTRTLRSVNRQTLMEYMQHELTVRHLSESYLHHKLTIISQLFSWAVLEGYVNQNPVQIKALPRLKRSQPRRQAFTEEQYRRLLRLLEKPDTFTVHIERRQKLWTHAAIVGWNTGLRFSDVCLLKWDFVLWDENILSVPTLKRARHGQIVEIPIQPELHAQLLYAWNTREESLRLEAIPRQPEESWRTPDLYSAYVHPELARTYQRDRVRLVHAFSELMRKLGLPHGFHGFRHGFVTRLLNAGIDPITIASMTGHSLEMLQSYAHVSVEAKRRALQQCATLPQAQPLTEAQIQ